jgi:5-carboxymethyl-2-hydroxymuconate isomerase
MIMPHLTLQYTENVDQNINFEELFSTLHHILADVGGIKIDNCKSRAIKLEDYYIGQGEDDHVFIHLDLRFLEGRSLELKQEIGRQILSTLKEYYAPSMAKYNMQITVEIRDIQRETYFKIPEGSFTLGFRDLLEMREGSKECTDG